MTWSVSALADESDPVLVGNVLWPSLEQVEIEFNKFY